MRTKSKVIWQKTAPQREKAFITYNTFKYISDAIVFRLTIHKLKGLYKIKSLIYYSYLYIWSIWNNKGQESSSLKILKFPIFFGPNFQFKGCVSSKFKQIQPPLVKIYTNFIGTDPPMFQLIKMLGHSKTRSAQNAPQRRTICFTKTTMKSAFLVHFYLLNKGIFLASII